MLSSFVEFGTVGAEEETEIKNRTKAEQEGCQYEVLRDLNRIIMSVAFASGDFVSDVKIIIKPYNSKCH